MLPTFITRTVAAAICGVLIIGGTIYAETVRVTVDRSTIWRNPTGTGGPLAIAARGTQLEVRGRQGRWLIVVHPTDPRQIGFILASQTEPIEDRPLDQPRPAAPIESQPARPPARTLPRQTVSSNSTGGDGSRSGGRSTFVVLNGGLATSPTELTVTNSAFADFYKEAGSLTATYGEPSRAQFQGLVGRQFGALGIGGGLVLSHTSKPATLSLSVPHPFLFDRSRSASGASDPLSASDVEIQVPFVWTAHLQANLSLTGFGGPSVFWASRELVNHVTLNDTYPFQDVSVTSAEAVKRSDFGFGGHAGVQAFWGARTAIGGGFMYSRGSVDLADGENATTDDTIGGPRVLVGLKFQF
jgi:hypothetical protein